MGSMYWTAEESRYLKAIFSWQDRFDDQLDGGQRVRDAVTKAGVGDLRVLIVGAPGVGKTALLTRFCADSFGADTDESFTRGGRRTIQIDGYLYNMDVLEMPSQHMVDLEAEADSNTEWPVFASTTAKRRGQCQSPAAMMLEQALAITEAAIVVYDVCDAVSFEQARRLYERLERTHKQPREGHPNTKTRAIHTSASTKPRQRMIRFRSYKRQRLEAEAAVEPPAVSRPFALLLVGNKSDADESGRQVASAEGTGVAGGSFLEASAKTGAQVDTVFEQIGRDILGQRQAHEAKRDEVCNATAMERDSSSASSSKSQMKRQPPRRPFMQRVFGLSFRRVAA